MFIVNFNNNLKLNKTWLQFNYLELMKMTFNKKYIINKYSNKTIKNNNNNFN